MPSPFPGMDPYLESPEIFPDFHDSFITYLREALQAGLPAPYFAALGRRVWIELSRRSIDPDVEVRRGPSPSPARSEAAQAVAVADRSDEFREPFIEIYTRSEGGKRLVASIEVLSLANKTAGEHGRDLYRKKQKELLESCVHLIEIDFLRGGEHTTAVPLELARDVCGAFDHHVSVRPFDELDAFPLYPIRLEDRLPPIGIPLLPGDPAVTLDLQAIFDRCHDAGPYAREVRYGEDRIIPPLDPAQAAWAATLLPAGAD
jgi:Protein of unknown function (DUF4058)